MRRAIILLMLAVMWLTAGARAAEADLKLPHGTETAAQQPVLPENSSWAGVMVIIILGMFLAAAGVGVAVRLNATEELPPPASHDDHGHDHAHGDDHGHGH